MEKRDILSMELSELRDYFGMSGQPAYRAKQVFSWLHQKGAAAFDAMSSLSKPLRQTLAQQFFIPEIKILKRLQSSDGTVKYLFGFADGNAVETVAMFYEHGMSVCVSTQVGCAMGCKFCASALGGLVRNLSAAEILLQVYTVSADIGKKADSVVLMGIGEPLDNFCNVVRFYDIITDNAGFGLANRKVSLSTSGLCDGIDRLASLKKQLTLSVSLHAADDAKRGKMMPVNRKYSIARLMESCRNYQRETGRRVSFEYMVLFGVNDSEADADALAKLVRGMGAHINLIPVNAAREGYTATREDAGRFLEKLLRRGVNATVRRTLGGDIEAACGQLRRSAAAGGGGEKEGEHIENNGRN